MITNQIMITQLLCSLDSEDYSHDVLQVIADLYEEDGKEDYSQALREIWLLGLKPLRYSRSLRSEGRRLVFAWLKYGELYTNQPFIVKYYNILPNELWNAMIQYGIRDFGGIMLFYSRSTAYCKLVEAIVRHGK